ncbi:hypothetical protein [Photobacterium phosphoreum]|uniref:hypothetical protein n=1 Tax=Photobacterium phosphoreum TaxID=659 RepID=UPI000D158343|nr:hypothetical protein [Photobacterium phosphoreum]PSU58636.1 hypothetical protein CTM75_16615 [Photobacterium phosphoreum]
MKLISPSAKKKDEMFLEELALRYFAFKHLDDNFKTTVAQYLTEFMRCVSNQEIPFDIDAEKDEFIKFIHFLLNRFGKEIFRPKGNFANHIFDSLAYAVPKKYSSIDGNEEIIERSIRSLLDDVQYNSIGTSTFSTTRIRTRMDRAMEIFNGA